MQSTIDNAWKATSKVLLGQEIGDISEYETYLKKYVEPKKKRKSDISGTEIITTEEIMEGTKIIGNNEQEQYYKTIENLELNINNIKDLDSIIEELKERFYYAGNIVLGNSSNVEKTTRCSNSSFIYECSDIYDSKYLGYSCLIIYGEYLFGCNAQGESQFDIKNFETYRSIRSMEVLTVYTGADCFYVGNMQGCNNCMFSFNLRNKHYHIGNLAFSKDRYMELKAKLVEDIRETLRTKKDLPSILDIVRG